MIFGYEDLPGVLCKERPFVSQTPDELSSRDDALNELISAWREAAANGEICDTEKFISVHPEFAAELRDAFAQGRLHEPTGKLGPCFAPNVGPGKTSVEQTLAKGFEEFDAEATMSMTAESSLAQKEPLARISDRNFGDYELLQEIARGGMGVVYKARQAKLNRLVALKLILAGQLAGSAEVKRFYIEAKASAQLDHPGIVPIFEVGQHDGQHFFSMGFIEGQSLAARVAKGPLSPAEAAHVVREIAEAVHYAHNKGVVHRDLKPGNILLDAQGKPRVTDFGLARLNEDRSELTGAGQPLGTPSYMPPEQASGKIDQIGPASDVYSLGAILYCLLIGRPPFHAASSMDTLLQVLNQEAVPLRQLNPHVPRDLETITLKCLQKDISRRYGSSQQLADELSRYLESRPILARPIGTFERCWRWCRRNVALAAVTFAMIIALLAGTVTSSYFAIRENSRAHFETIAKGDATEKLYRSLVDQARANRLSRRMGQRYKTLEILTKAIRMARDMSRSEADLVELRSELIACLTLEDVQPIHTSGTRPSGTFWTAADNNLQRFIQVDLQGNVSVRRLHRRR